MPKKIALNQIAEILAETFKQEAEITCYLGSNAATPTASIETLTEAIKRRKPKLPFLKMVHLLLQGPVPYVQKGLQDRIMAYSTFSAGNRPPVKNHRRRFGTRLSQAGRLLSTRRASRSRGCARRSVARGAASPRAA